MCYKKKDKSSNPVPRTEDVEGVGCMEAVHILLVKLLSNDEESLEKNPTHKINLLPIKPQYEYEARNKNILSLLKTTLIHVMRNSFSK